MEQIEVRCLGAEIFVRRPNDVSDDGAKHGESLSVEIPCDNLTRLCAWHDRDYLKRYPEAIS